MGADCCCPPSDQVAPCCAVCCRGRGAACFAANGLGNKRRGFWAGDQALAVPSPHSVDPMDQCVRTMNAVALGWQAECRSEVYAAQCKAWLVAAEQPLGRASRRSP